MAALRLAGARAVKARAVKARTPKDRGLKDRAPKDRALMVARRTDAARPAGETAGAEPPRIAPVSSSNGGARHGSRANQGRNW
jgi:hypothetical protein